MLIYLALIVTSIAHWGSIAQTQKYDDQHYDSIYVKNCRDVFVPIYADKEMTTPIPNPFMSKRDGSYEYYSQYSREKVTIIHLGPDGSHMTMVNTCKTKQ